MMGRLEGQERLFYALRLKEHVPADHLLRRIDAALDLSFVRGRLAATYSRIGRPSVDPELTIRMLLVGYLFGIRSERRLCEEVHLSLAHAGIAGSGSTAARPTTRPSARTGTAGSAAATSTASCSARW